MAKRPFYIYNIAFLNFSAGKYQVTVESSGSASITLTEDTTTPTLVFETTETGDWVESYNYQSIESDAGPGADFTANPKIGFRPYFDIGPFIVRFTVN